MRILTLSLIFFSALYYFNRGTQKSVESDAVELKQSAVKRPQVTPKPKVELAEVAREEVPEIEESLASAGEISHQANSEEIAHESADNGGDIPWDEVEAGWKQELKDILVRLDPVNGEEIYDIYQAEKEAYRKELENLSSQEDSFNEEGKVKKASSRYDSMVNELVDGHHERLKEILGSHYDQIKQEHEQYIESIQHLNRSGDFEIGVAL